MSDGEFAITVIELDEVAGWEPQRRSRPWLAIGLLVAAVLALAAGAAPAPPLNPSVVLPGVGIRQIRTEGDTIYLMRQPDVAHGALESYRLADGTRHWASPIDPNAQIIDASRGRVVLSAPSALVGLDATSGAQVWQRAGYAPVVYASAGASGVVLAAPSTPGTDRPGPDGPLLGIDARTGDTRWSLPAPDGTIRTIVQLDRERVEVAELDPDGTLRLRSADTAAIVRTAKLDKQDSIHGFDVAGDRLLAYRSNQRGMVGAAVFDLATGRRLWQATTDPGEPPMWWCGRILCTGVAGAITALDPDTGRELWRLEGLTDLTPLDDAHLLATPSTADPHEPRLGGLVLDATTGRIVRRLDGWDPVGRAVWPDLLVASRNAGGPALVAWLNVVTGAVTVFGRATHWLGPPRCDTTTTVLACRLDQVAIWPISRGRAVDQHR